MHTGQHRLQEILSDRYTVEREIGKGGYATVYLARDNKHQRNVAIKLLSREVSGPQVIERFRAEIELVASLVHPNIIRILDSGASGHTLFYVMPLVEGETLRQRIVREGRLPLDDALAITRDLGAGLSYAHSRKIVHRDIKPENALMIQGSAVLTDFGIARALQPDGAEGEEIARLTAPGNSIGTPIYMSPEQANGGDVDERSDVYSLACVLFEMLAGEPPINGMTPQQVMVRKLTTIAPSLDQVGVVAPPAIESALATALKRDPDERFATMKQFIDALAGGRARLDTPTETMMVPETVSRPIPVVRQGFDTRLVKWGVAAAVVIAAAAAVVFTRG